MQTRLETLRKQKFLFIALIITSSLVVLANQFGEKMSMVVTDLIYGPIIIILTVLAIISASTSDLKSDHGKAWLFFVLGAISWAIAEHLWMIYELVLEEDPFPSAADFFYLGGYPFVFLFMIYYLKFIRTAISKKIIVAASLVALAIGAPSIYLSYDLDSEISTFDLILATTYPIVDAIIFVPAMIGVILFFSGRVNFMWTLMCIGIISLTLADAGFLAAEYDGSYYTGHPIDILFIWTYVLFSFGIYDHIKIFREKVVHKTPMTERNPTET
ncbi:MAG TPA: hypothetical protein VLB45_00315 [Nitrosopumilaceae archaeon]|nr:hypothetical protein [Nitrosopumilaceae archaeon]